MKRPLHLTVILVSGLLSLSGCSDEARRVLDKNVADYAGMGLGWLVIALLFLVALGAFTWGIIFLENFRRAYSSSDNIQRSMVKYSGVFITLTICSAIAYVIGTIINANHEMLLQSDLVGFVTWGLGVGAFGLIALAGLALLSVGFVVLENFRKAHGSNEAIQRSLVKYSGVFIPLTVCSLIVVGMGASVHANRDLIAVSLKVSDPKLLILDMLVWLLLVTVSVMALREIRSVLIASKARTLVFQAHMIGIIVGVGMVAFLFVQPYLDVIFPVEVDSKFLKVILEVLLLGAGGAGGWSVWYFTQLRDNGDFWYVMLLTLLIGITWYARLTAPQEAKLFAATAVLASLVRIALEKLKKSRLESATDQQSGMTGPQEKALVESVSAE